MLHRFNQYLQKWMPILTPLSLIIGVLFENIGHQLVFLVPWIFAFMTFAGSLSMNIEGIKSLKKVSNSHFYSHCLSTHTHANLDLHCIHNHLS